MLDNKSARFKYETTTPKETPGPGAYNLSKQSDWIKEMNRNASAPATRECSQKAVSCKLASTSWIKLFEQLIYERSV